MQDLAQIKLLLLAKPGSEEYFPFGPEEAVYKLSGKIFALLAWQQVPLQLSLKCDPDEAQILRQMYPSVQPGYHLNKEHWNTVTIDGTIPDTEINAMIDHSYQLILDGLPKKLRGKFVK